MQNHLVIFAKEPRIGRVKTRLAREVGPVRAWRFYLSMLQKIPKRLKGKGPWKVWLSISPDEASRKAFPCRHVSFLRQGKGDLGRRMLRPASQLPCGPFVVIGTDIPGIQPCHIRKAFRMLGRKDVVFGPAEDGGFWLVGYKRHPYMKDPYQGKVRWSHPETLEDCLKNMERHKVGFVDCLADVDCAADLFAMT